MAVVSILVRSPNTPVMGVTNWVKGIVGKTRVSPLFGKLFWPKVVSQFIPIPFALFELNVPIYELKVGSPADP